MVKIKVVTVEGKVYIENNAEDYEVCDGLLQIGSTEDGSNFVRETLIPLHRIDLFEVRHAKDADFGEVK